MWVWVWVIPRRLADPRLALSIPRQVVARCRAMSAKDWSYSTFVSKLGKDLKEKNKARVVIEDILRSDIYRSADFQAGGSN